MAEITARDQINLLIPGPTPLPPEVRAAMAQPMIDHRSEAFGRMLNEVLTGLQQIFQTTSPVLPFAASGTGGLEAAVVNTLSPGDRVIALCCGVFGERFASVADAFGAEVIREETEWGTGVDPARVAAALRAHGPVKAVLVTHNETSTGVSNRLRDLARAIRPSGALILVDAVSSLGALELHTDEWGLDVVITGSQKALMGPPGAVFLSVSARALDAAKTSRTPKLYFSFARALAQIESSRAFTPWTPVVPVVYALQVSVAMVLREGLEACWARHEQLAQATRAGVQAMGLRLFADPAWASNAVTAVRLPERVDGKTLLSRLREEHGVYLAGGQGRLEGKIFRIGHMGYVQEGQLREALRALEAVLRAG